MIPILILYAFQCWSPFSHLWHDFTQNDILLRFNNLYSAYLDIRDRTMGLAKPSNIARIQTFSNVPWYVSNLTLHQDSNLPTVLEEIGNRFQKFHANLSSHPNPLVQQLSSHTRPLNPLRRLNRQWPRDLLDQRAKSKVSPLCDNFIHDMRVHLRRYFFV
jgi:hypothetical protein